MYFGELWERSEELFLWYLQGLILVTKTSVTKIYLNLNFTWPFKVWKIINLLGNGDLTKEFYVFFWHGIKEIFINSSRRALEKKELSISQRKAITKLIEKRIKEIKDL